MRPAPTRLPLLQCTKADRLPASSRTASNSRPNVASPTTPCPIGMLTYSRPAWSTASGVLNGRGSMASRMSITTAHPARFSAARCSDAGCPPVTIPGIGSQALGTPAMASRRWLIGIGAASFRRSIYLIRMASSRRPSLRAHLKPHHKLWLDWDGAFLMGPRYLHFLDAVARAGAIRAEARGSLATMRSSSVIAVLMLCSGPRLAAQTPAPVSTTPKLSGYVQARFQSIGDSAVFSLRRARLGAQGNLTSWASYKVQAELRSGGTGATAATVAATDLYLALTHRRWTATIGQSKTPLSAEFIRSSTVFELPEHSMAVDSLSPNRDVGVKLEWNTAGTLALQGGVFNGDGINRAANRDKRFLYMGRAVVRAAKGAYLGMSAAAKPDTTTWDAEAWVERGRVAVRGEFLARHRSVAAVTTLGWYALGAYGVVPKRLQLVGRVQQFDPNDRAGADRVTGYTGGVQYFFSGDDLKLQLEYTIFDEQGPSIDNNRVILQMQARW